MMFGLGERAKPDPIYHGVWANQSADEWAGENQGELVAG